MALWERNPDKGLIWHTDRGSQYASDSHRKILNQHHVIQSMSRKGNCWDNAVSENFFHPLKTELVHHHQYQTREKATQAIFEYIKVFYNRERIYSANDYLSPVDYELQQKKLTIIVQKSVDTSIRNGSFTCTAFAVWRQTRPLI